MSPRRVDPTPQDIFAAAEEGQRLISMLAGLRRQAVTEGFTEAAAEHIVMTMFAAAAHASVNRRGR